MTHFKKIAEIPAKEIVPGIRAKFVHTEGMTIGHVELDEGAILPHHNHPHEQVSNIISGQFEMTIGKETKICIPGDVVVIPSNAFHSGRALTPCEIIDIFRPIREDYQ